MLECNYSQIAFGSGCLQTQSKHILVVVMATPRAYGNLRAQTLASDQKLDLKGLPS